MYDYFADEKNVYMVLEFAKNGNLYKFIKKKGNLTEQEAFDLFYQSCKGVEALHNKNIIHRDLKPENLQLDENFVVKVCDFGWSVESSESYRSTFCGTVDYMVNFFFFKKNIYISYYKAPEIVGNRAYTKSVDIWSLGVLLYELLHGYPPYHGGSENDRMMRISKGTNFPFKDDISQEAKDLIKRLMSLNHSSRPNISEIFTLPWIQNCLYPSKFTPQKDSIYRNSNNREDAQTWGKKMFNATSKDFFLNDHRKLRYKRT